MEQGVLTIANRMIAPEAAAMQVKKSRLTDSAFLEKVYHRAGLHMSKMQGLIRFRSGRLLGLKDQIQEKKFPGKPGKQCGECEYFQICRFR